AVEPLTPHAPDRILEVAQPLPVAGDPVVLVVTLQLQRERSPLLGDLVMQVAPAPFAYRTQCPTKAAAHGPTLHDRLTPARSAPMMREAEHVECPRPCPAIRRRAWLLERYEPGLARVERESIFRKPLADPLIHPARRAARREYDDRAVRIADQKRLARKPGLHVRFEPHVEHLVEIYVRQER